MESFLSLFLKGSNRSVVVKKNIIASFAIKGISVIVSLALVPMTLGYVSSEIYGIWLTLSSIVVWMSFFDVGFNLGLKNKLAEAIALNDYERGKKLVSTTYILMMLIFIPLCIIVELVLPYINWTSILNIDIKYEAEVLLAMRILVVCFCANMIANVLTSVIAAHQKTALSQLFPVIGNILSLGIIYLMTKFCLPSLPRLTLAISLVPVLVLFMGGLILFRTLFKNVCPSIHSFDKSYIRDLFSLGVKFFVIKLQLVILYQMTNFLISNISGPNDVTSYNIAYKYLNVIMMAYTIILDPLWPAFTDAYTKNDNKWMRNVYGKMLKVYILLACGLVIMVLLSSIVYRLWIDDKAIVPMVMTISVAIYVLISAWVQLQVQIINGVGKIQLQTYVTLIGLFAHIPLSFLLGKWFSCLGVVYSMILINIVYSFFFTIQNHKILNQTAVGIWNR